MGIYIICYRQLFFSPHLCSLIAHSKCHLNVTRCPLFFPVTDTVSCRECWNLLSREKTTKKGSAEQFGKKHLIGIFFFCSTLRLLFNISKFSSSVVLKQTLAYINLYYSKKYQIYYQYIVWWRSLTLKYQKINHELIWMWIYSSTAVGVVNLLNPDVSSFKRSQWQLHQIPKNKCGVNISRLVINQTATMTQTNQCPHRFNFSCSWNNM